MLYRIFFVLLQFNVHVCWFDGWYLQFANNGKLVLSNWTACTYELHNNIILYKFVKHDMSDADRYTYHVIRSYTSAGFRNTTFIHSQLNTNSIWWVSWMPHIKKGHVSSDSRRILLVQIIITNAIAINSDILRNTLLFVSAVNATDTEFPSL